MPLHVSSTCAHHQGVKIALHSFWYHHTNNQTHSIHTRYKTNLHPPTANLTKFQKAVHYSAITIFNNLPHNIKDLANDILPFRNV